VSETSLSSLYLDDGYLFYQLTPVEILVENDSIDIEMRIQEGKQARVNRVTVIGNTKTNDHVILREIRTKPGDLFRRSDIIRTQRELAQLGYFDPEKLNVTPKPDPATATVDLEYIVAEKPSDQIELSGGWGAQMIVGTLGLTFNNFSTRNIFNKSAWSPLPTGDGQRLSLRAQTNGVYYQSYSISFMEPWLGGKKPNSLSLSFYHNIFSNGREKTDPARYSMKITGVSVGLGRRLKWPDDYFILYNELSYQLYDLDNYSYKAITLIVKEQYQDLLKSYNKDRTITAIIANKHINRGIHEMKNKIVSKELALFNISGSNHYSIFGSMNKLLW
jgi:outer membrane protein insertion porin family